MALTLTHQQHLRRLHPIANDRPREIGAAGHGAAVVVAPVPDKTVPESGGQWASEQLDHTALRGWRPQRRDIIQLTDTAP